MRSQPISNPKGNQNAQNKYSDIQEEDVPAKDKSIAIEKDRDCQCPRQEPNPKGGEDTGELIPEPESHDGRIQEHGKEQ